MTIPPRVRRALLLKGLGLAALGLVFFAVAVGGLRADWSLLARVPFSLFFAALGLFPFGVSRLALFDALFGEAVEVAHAVALQPKQRRAGYSLRLPDGHFAEFLLTNPDEPIVPDARYTVVIGRCSRVLIAAPRREE